MYKIDNWINEGSGCIIKSIEGVYVNISAYSPLIRSTYIKLPDELKHPMKLHKLGTYDVYKISLSCFDDKIYVLDDGGNTLAYFHKDMKN